MYSSIFKRTLDLILCSIALIILSPFFLLTALIIKIDSKGPVLFKQARLGKNEKQFKLYKFRTMTHKIRTTHRDIFLGDPEVTKVGEYLRRLKVDELPQLINVIKGDMSIVGPRPCLPEVKSKFGTYAEVRFKLKPGLTSLAAIKGSIFLTWEEKGFWDAQYVQTISFKTDLWIILNTFNVILKGEEALFKKGKELS